MIAKPILKSFREKTDIYLSSFIILASTSALIIAQLINVTQNIIFETLVASLISAICYVLTSKITSISIGIKNTEIPAAGLPLLNLAYLLLVVIATFVSHMFLHAPSLFYLLIVLCSALIVVDILYGKSNYYSYLTLFKIYIIAFLLLANLFYDFAGFYGADPWEHMYWVQLWEEVGYISTGASGIIAYNYPPFFHIEVLNSWLLTDLNLKDSFFCSLGFIYTTLILFVFLFVKKTFGTKIGLLSSLFIAINPYYLLWGVLLVPTSIGLVTLTILFYLIHARINKNKLTLIIIILSIFLYNLHTLSSLLILIALIFYLALTHLSKNILDLNLRSKLKTKSAIFLASILFILSFIRFTYLSYTPNKTFLESILYSFRHTLKTEFELAGGEITTYVSADYPLNRVFFILIIFFAVFGALFLLKRETQSAEKIGLIGTSLGLMLLAYVPALLNISTFLPGRWIPFAMVLCAPICAIGLYQLSLIPSGKRYQVTSLLLIVMIFSFFAINSHFVNPRAPFYGELPEDSFRRGYTQSEMQAADTITTITFGSTQVVFDSSYVRRTFPYYEIEKFGYEDILSRETLYDLDYIKIVRPVDTYEGVNFIGEKKQNSLIYNSQSVCATLHSSPTEDYRTL